MLAAIGFAEKHAAAAGTLRRGRRRAADWLFSNADDLESAVAEAEAQSGRGAGGGAADVSTLSAARPRRVPVRGRARDLRAFGVVSHGREHGVRPLRRVKSQGEWCIFNDERVARSREPPLDMGYLYFYRRAS